MYPMKQMSSILKGLLLSNVMKLNTQEDDTCEFLVFAWAIIEYNSQWAFSYQQQGWFSFYF